MEMYIASNCLLSYWRMELGHTMNSDTTENTA